MTKDILLLFATPLTCVQIDHPEFFQKYADLVASTFTDEQLAKLQRLGSICTVDNLHELEEFHPLQNLIDREAMSFFNEYLGLDHHDLYMTGMWSNIHVGQGYHQIHQHPNSFYSGVIYLEIPEETEDTQVGKLLFIDPRTAKNMQFADFKKDNELSNREVIITPEVGKLLFFPSWFEHGTGVSILKPGQRRISVSFNYGLTRSSAYTMKFNVKPN
jgi:uncharacterized protein (TIGR02466 family)